MSRKRLQDAYVEGGRAAIEGDPELRALLAADAEFAALLDTADALDAGLKALPKTRMPDDLAWQIAAETRGRRSWARADLGLAAAALLLLALLPPAVGAFLMDQRSAEFSVLELPASTVRFLAPSLANAPGAAMGGQLQQVADAPTARLVVEGGLGRKLDSIGKPLSEGRVPARAAVHTEALVNAVPFLAKAELTSEVGPSPWSSQTRLLRVQVSARTQVNAAQLEVAFHTDRVASYRLLASGLGPDSAPSGKLAPGDTFVALFEVVAKLAIADAGGELATIRYRGGAEERASVSVVESALAFDAMPAAYRFAASAAWLGLALSGESTPHAFDRILMLASQALQGAPRAESRAFLTLVVQAQSAVANAASN